jgi:integral membrane sensor domain MASE1
MVSHALGFPLSEGSTGPRIPSNATDDVVVTSSTGFLRPIAVALLVAISYYAGSQIGFLLTPVHHPLATFWPPNAILLAALLLTPVRQWWIILLAVLPAHLIVQLNAGIPLTGSFGWFIGNSGEALIGAACIRHFRDANTLFSDVKGIFIFLLFGVFVGPSLTSFVDAATVVWTYTGNDYWISWMTRLSSNMVAALTLVPSIALAVLHGARWARKATIQQRAEAALLMFGTAVVTWAVFRQEGGPQSIGLACAPVPFLLWGALRFGMGGFSACMLVFTLISISNTMQGRGPLLGSSLARSIASLHVFLITLGIPLTTLAALSTERRAAKESFIKSRRGLINAHDRERHRFAQALQADIAQRATIIGLELDRVESDSGQVRASTLTDIREQLSDISTSVLDLAEDLHPFTLEYLGLLPALKKLCRTIDAAGMVKIKLSVQHIPARLPAHLAISLYRTIQEALRGLIACQSGAAIVNLDSARGRVQLRIVGERVSSTIDPETNLNAELAEARERTLALGGTFQIQQGSSKDTIIEVALPLNDHG